MSDVNDIPSGWVETTLGNICKVESGGTPSTKNNSFWNGKIGWITPKDLSGFNGVYIDFGERNITQKGLDNSSAKLLPKHTILFSSRAPIGYVAIAKNELSTNQGFKNLICDEKNSHFKFFYYLLKQLAGYIEKLSSGSTFSEASASLIKSIEIKVPENIEEQKAIANILKAFDDKIENLQAQNKTLEQTAQTIFKEWFGKYQVGDELPEGWRVGKLGDFNATIVDFVANGSFASLKENVTLYEEPEYALFVRNTDLKSNFKEKKYVDRKSYEFLSKSKLYGGEIIISNVGDVGSVHFCPHFDIPMTLGNNVIMLKSDFQAFFYTFFNSIIGQHLISTITGGSAQPKFNKTDFRNMGMVIPQEGVLNRFEGIASDFYKKVFQNKNQIETLKKTRETLLPKLMSGKIRIKI